MVHLIGYIGLGKNKEDRNLTHNNLQYCKLTGDVRLTSAIVTNNNILRKVLFNFRGNHSRFATHHYTTYSNSVLLRARRAENYQSGREKQLIVPFQLTEPSPPLHARLSCLQAVALSSCARVLFVSTTMKNLHTGFFLKAWTEDFGYWPKWDTFLHPGGIKSRNPKISFGEWNGNKNPNTLQY